MHVLTHESSGPRGPAPLWRRLTLWPRLARTGLALLPALALSLTPLAQAEARPTGVPIQHAVASGTGDLPLVNVQHYRHHGPPPGYYRHRGPPPGYWGPPRHHRGYHRPPPRHWRGPPPRGVWVPAPPPPPRYYYRSHRSYDPGAAAAAGVVGLAAGALLGSALTAQAAPPPHSNSWLSYCASKYRSFDPASGTYLGYDGRRHPCR